MPLPRQSDRLPAPWLPVAVAALAMVATLPGRTHGLGLVTEPLLKDLGLDPVHYGAVNLWATLLGALFCWPAGWLIDRLGCRLVLAGTLLSLGAVVVVMGQVQGDWIVDLPWLGSWTMDLFLLVLLTRGLGQSALSVVSITLLGRSTGRRSGTVIGVYSFLVALGFMTSFSLIKFVMETWEPSWREVWAGIGWMVLALGPLAWFLVRPSLAPQNQENRSIGPTEESEPFSFTLKQALLSPAFWVFGLATSLYGLIASGVALFNQSLLAERGFERGVFLTITALAPLVGLASNLGSGWLATRWPPGWLLGLAMLILTAALFGFPLVETLLHVYVYAAAMAIAGGMITVIFFAFWRQAFGKKHLGQIQGIAQMLTVLASALGPLLLADCRARTGSYVPFLQVVAVLSGALALAAWWVPLPRRSPDVSTNTSTVSEPSSSGVRSQTEGVMP